jgi:N-acetylmuramoyl-L-alanine amidase
MPPVSIRRTAARCGLLLVLFAVPAWPLAGADPAVTLQVASEVDESGARAILTFSRQVDYRLEEYRSRLSLLFDEPLDEISQIERSVEGGTLRRILASSSSRGSEVIFYLGHDFETFSSAELIDPFRVVLQFQKKGAPRASSPAPWAGAGATAGAETAQPGMPAPSSVAGSPAGFPAQPALPAGARVVVLDPGHGGVEDGAVGAGGLKEKDLVLDIAGRLRSVLQRSGYVVLLSREDDSSLDLTRRTAAANHAGAELFLSIHANSSARAAARGAESYFLSYGAVADSEAKSVADRENLQGAGPSGPEASSSEGEIRLVLWDMAQAEHLSASSRLADLIQVEMNALGETKDRGVKQAPFRVLFGAAMPATLVEVGFVSNPDEETKLATGDYRDRIAGALAAAIRKFDEERGRQQGAPPNLPGGAPR